MGFTEYLTILTFNVTMKLQQNSHLQKSCPKSYATKFSHEQNANKPTVGMFNLLHTNLFHLSIIFLNISKCPITGNITMYFVCLFTAIGSIILNCNWIKAMMTS